MITICSNQVDMILVAKYNTKVFMTIALVVRIAQLILCVVLYSFWGLLGLGISYGLLGVLHMTIMSLVVYKLYNIHFSQEFVKVGIIVLGFTIAATFVSSTLTGLPGYITAAILVVVAAFYSYTVSKNKLNIDFLKIVKNRIKK